MIIALSLNVAFHISPPHPHIPYPYPYQAFVRGSASRSLCVWCGGVCGVVCGCVCVCVCMELKGVIRGNTKKKGGGAGRGDEYNSNRWLFYFSYTESISTYHPIEEDAI
jgi:hypothetical protein